MPDSTLRRYREFIGEFIVYDRTGRRIANVFACNPETGEAITFDSSQLTRAWIRLVNRLPLQQWWRDVSACKRHGFWPAPLTVEPCHGIELKPEYAKQAEGKSATLFSLTDPGSHA